MRRTRWLSQPWVEIWISAVVALSFLVFSVVGLRVPAHHETDTIAVTLIILAIGNVLQTFVEIALWYTMRKQHDETKVGLGLKGKWFSLAWKNAVVAAMFIMFAVWMYSPLEPAGWLRLGLYGASAAATITSAIWGLFLIRWLIIEHRSGLKSIGVRH